MIGALMSALYIFKRLSWQQWLGLVAAAVVGTAIGWTVLELRAGARAQERVETLEKEIQRRDEADELRRANNAAEQIRLEQEKKDRLTFGRLTDEAREDPGAAAPALSVRSVNRLNQIR